MYVQRVDCIRSVTIGEMVCCTVCLWIMPADDGFSYVPRSQKVCLRAYPVYVRPVASVLVHVVTLWCSSWFSGGVQTLLHGVLVVLSGAEETTEGQECDACEHSL